MKYDYKLICATFLLCCMLVDACLTQGLFFNSVSNWHKDTVSFFESLINLFPTVQCDFSEVEKPTNYLC